MVRIKSFPARSVIYNRSRFWHDGALNAIMSFENGRVFMVYSRAQAFIIIPLEKTERKWRI